MYALFLSIVPLLAAVSGELLPAARLAELGGEVPAHVRPPNIEKLEHKWLPSPQAPSDPPLRPNVQLMPEYAHVKPEKLPPGLKPDRQTHVLGDHHAGDELWTPGQGAYHEGRHSQGPPQKLSAHEARLRQFAHAEWRDMLPVERDHGAAQLAKAFPEGKKSSYRDFERMRAAHPKPEHFVTKPFEGRPTRVYEKGPIMGPELAELKEKWLHASDRDRWFRQERLYRHLHGGLWGHYPDPLRKGKAILHDNTVFFHDSRQGPNHFE